MADTLKLITFNIAHGRGLSLYQKFSSPQRIRKNLHAIGELMAKVDADVVALQEVDEDSHWNWNINLLHEIQTAAGFEHAELGVTNRREGKRPLAYGNAILSRHPLEHWHNQAFGEATLGEKGFLYAEIDYKGHTLPLLNAHLDFRSRKRRLEQVEQIIDYLITHSHRGKDGAPLAPIICGDFNSRSAPKADAVNHLFQHILAHREYQLFPKNQKTFPTHLPSKVIDFIFLPEPYKMQRCEVLPGFLSDHKPVLLEFSLGE
ncbi:endonuclease/exonuclease/phosphatase family protein [Cerasicoccus arenae]|uniref:Endonuclease n=1 Tax=Cerasicoccus arenae TaxID=424488 RepID=A0A8J3DFH2_9BACT|nr:endonuclease/exonuclease/phosphatase family protein [Cerasicoccus arenae]MBK1857278.1 endonuclease/exonuclease/phosphatase family protein [Cerasicoccus arenae]GHC00428.1 endonuclease [Cerasicoccus arenae]